MCYYKHKTSPPVGNPSTTEYEYLLAFVQREQGTVDLDSVAHPKKSQRLQSHLDIMKNRLKDGEKTIRDKEHRYHIIEDELARTRLNYEEQIEVLTEQVVSLSEQLASCK